MLVLMKYWSTIPTLANLASAVNFRLTRHYKAPSTRIYSILPSNSSPISCRFGSPKEWREFKVSKMICHQQKFNVNLSKSEKTLHGFSHRGKKMTLHKRLHRKNWYIQSCLVQLGTMTSKIYLLRFETLKI